MNNAKLTVTCEFHVTRLQTGLDGKFQPWIVQRGHRVLPLTEDSDPALALHEYFAESDIALSSLVLENPK